jgi:hypothetical protein
VERGSKRQAGFQIELHETHGCGACRRDRVAQQPHAARSAIRCDDAKARMVGLVRAVGVVLAARGWGGQRERFAAGRCAGVEDEQRTDLGCADSITGELCEPADDLGGFVLCDEQSSRYERRTQWVAAADDQPVRRVRRRLCGDVGLGKPCSERLARCPQGVRPKRQRRVAIVEPRPRLRGSGAVSCGPAFDQPARVREGGREIVGRGRRRQQGIARRGRDLAQHRVDEAGGARAFALSRQRDRIINDRARRNAIQEEQLIRAQSQDTEHHGVDALDWPRDLGRDRAIERRAPTEDARRDLRRQRFISRTRYR